MHKKGEPCPVIDKAVAEFGKEAGMELLWSETCFPMDDRVAMKQLDEFIEKRRAAGGGPRTDWWWLSFASDSGFLGGLFIQAYDFEDAIAQSWAAGLNPGGEVCGARADGVEPPNRVTNQLLSLEDMEQLGLSPGRAFRDADNTTDVE